MVIQDSSEKNYRNQLYNRSPPLRRFSKLYWNLSPWQNLCFITTRPVCVCTLRHLFANWGTRNLNLNVKINTQQNKQNKAMSANFELKYFNILILKFNVKITCSIKIFSTQSLCSWRCISCFAGRWFLSSDQVIFVF